MYICNVCGRVVSDQLRRLYYFVHSLLHTDCNRKSEKENYEIQLLLLTIVEYIVS